MPSDLPAAFHGCPIVSASREVPHLLYRSDFRVIITYAMSLEDLDSRLKRALASKGCRIEEDQRNGALAGSLYVLTGDGTKVNVRLEICGSIDGIDGQQKISQLTYSVPF